MHIRIYMCMRIYIYILHIYTYRSHIVMPRAVDAIVSPRSGFVHQRWIMLPHDRYSGDREKSMRSVVGGCDQRKNSCN